MATNAHRVLVTGAGRGLGLEFARQYRAEGFDVIATCRDRKAAAALATLGCEAVLLDVTDASAIEAFAARVPPNSIDLMVLNAGVAGERISVLQPTTSEDFDAVMRTNVFGPMRFIAAFADRVKDGGKIAVISSRMGSIGEISTGRSALYRASKAAVNAVACAASVELAPRSIAVIVLHPGWVKTDMGGAGAGVEIKVSITGIRAVIERAVAAEGARFRDYTGAAVAW